MAKIRGLTTEEAEVRHQSLGPNEIVASVFDSRWSDLKKILLNPMGLMLLGLSCVYFIIGNKVDSLVLLLAFIPITLVDVVLDLRASKALSALKETIKLTAKVLRDERIQEIATRKIVSGDVIIFEEGQSVPADGTIIEANQLMMNESALTGESVPVEKLIQNQFYAGTLVLQGRGIGVVDSIGKATRFGKIATLLEETEAKSSPLQKRVHELVKWVILAALALALGLFFVEYIRSNQGLRSFIVALTFGMAAVPEEFPLVFTLYLSLGAWRLSRDGVLVKSLPSVETLGSVDVICTDKTGTLTEGKFQLEELHSVHEPLAMADLWLYALMACEEKAIDSMETAIHEKGKAFQTELNHWYLKWDYPFERLGKHMSHVWEHSQSAQKIIAMKGAVEGVLEHCQIDSSAEKQLLKLVDSLAGQGKRLLGLAYGKHECSGIREKDEQGLIFAGLLIFSDPIRISAKQAIADCQMANIQIKMLTGDHPLTAHAVADQIDIHHSHDQLFTGDELARMSKEQRWVAYQNGVIFSRVLPEQKHEMVQALKEAGKVVAMTGDGINDAPALKLADIGISMGQNATDVARSSAQMILLKNDFNGIVKAVFEGRRIFLNLKRSFSYLISFHVPIVFLAFVPPVLGWGDLLLPIHIVLLELIVHPISAFGFENLPRPDLKEPLKRGSTEMILSERSLLSLRRFLEAFLAGTLLSFGTLILFRSYMIRFNLDGARSISLVTILFGNIGFVLTESWSFFSKRILFIVFSLLTLACLLIWIPQVTRLFHLEYLSLLDISLALGVGILASIPTLIMRRKSH